MIDLFEGLEKLGFKDTKGVDLYKKESPKTLKKEEAALNPENLLYFKEYECPVCDGKFKNSVVKLRMAKHIKSDTDLRMYFEPIDPMYYDIILCSLCGYASLSATFNRITSRQVDKIKAGITEKYKPREYPLLLSLDDAIERYKMALLNAFVKSGKDGEKAYLCLKLAWLYREVPDPLKERTYLGSALKGFESAYANENFPICGIDETTLTYMLADIARRLGQDDTALRYLSRIITNQSVPQRIKDKAADIKNLIRGAETSSRPLSAPTPAPKAAAAAGKKAPHELPSILKKK